MVRDYIGKALRQDSWGEWLCSTCGNFINFEGLLRGKAHSVWSTLKIDRLVEGKPRAHAPLFPCQPCPELSFLSRHVVLAASPFDEPNRENMFCLLCVFPNRIKDAPILGVVPWADNLDQPSTMDLEVLFNTTALAGRQHLLRRLVFRWKLA